MEKNSLSTIENMESEVYPKSRIIAVVSGKGGSGKTMVATVMARILDDAGFPTLIVDADTATGGMTYYLGLKHAQNIGAGLSNFAINGDDPAKIKGGIQNLEGFNNTKFFGIGDHSLLYREVPETKVPNILIDLLEKLRLENRWIVVDCRGGIDQDSIAVCKAADDVLLVVETDTTSFQSTLHLVDILAMKDLSYKIRGFVINKVFDNPSYFAKNGTAVFKGKYLSSIPFDFRAMRAFLIGEIPIPRSFFSIHVWDAMHKAYPDLVPSPEYRPWTFKEYKEIGLTNLDSMRGGLMVGSLIFILGFTWLVTRFTNSKFLFIHYEYMITLLILFGLIGSLETTRRFIGSLMNRLIEILNSIFDKDY